MIDIPKLIGELERAGDSWGSRDLDSNRMRDLCRRAAMALKEQRAMDAREIMHRLGLLLIELGRKLTGESV